jgi:hypothetical protein
MAGHPVSQQIADIRSGNASPGFFRFLFLHFTMNPFRKLLAIIPLKHYGVAIEEEQITGKDGKIIN